MKPAPQPNSRAPDREPVQLTWVHGDEARVKWLAAFLALAIHLVALSVNLPEMKRTAPERDSSNAIVIRKYVPPPPAPPERQRIVRRTFTRRVPVPDPTPDEPEPIREPTLEIRVERPRDDFEYLLGVPEPPPARDAGPLIPGVGGVTEPIRIEDSYVAPVYPELARVSRVEGNVVVEAIIHADGTVGQTRILSCDRPRFQFESAALAAVGQWRYEPGLLDGQPVDVYLTVFVQFRLL